MALPTSGQLSLKDIGVELGITAGNQASLRSMSSTAGKSVPDSVSEFYGYSAADNIVASWGGQGTPSTTTTTFDWWRIVSFSGLNSASIRPHINLVCTNASSGSVTMYSGLSSSGPWYSIGSRSSIGTTSCVVSASSPATSANTLYIRMFISRSTFGNVAGNFALTNSYTLVSGTVNSYSGSGTWAYNF